MDHYSALNPKPHATPFNTSKNRFGPLWQFGSEGSALMASGLLRVILGALKGIEGIEQVKEDLFQG